MSKATWRKWFSIVSNRLYLYPEPEPMPRSRVFWFAMGIVAVAVLLFCGYFILYMTSQHDAYWTNAEDLGIMDQVVWSILHSGSVHQTICNTLHDTNCYSSAGVSRWAIHFDPLLIPVSALYIFWPTPKALVVLQTIVVALGAFPAFWLARLRLRSELAGVALALLYLLYPAVHQEVTFDFHAATFATSFIMFMLYFMYTRRTVWVFVFAILAMMCKEQIPLVIIMLGLWSIVFQRRWRSGLGLVAVGAIWFIGAFYIIIPHFSPSGKHLLITRYDDFKNFGTPPGQTNHSYLQLVLNILRHPRAFLKTYVFDQQHLNYLHILFAPGGYLPSLGPLPALYLVLLAPWVLILALPTLAANMASSRELMYSGLFQYNAEIVPILVFAVTEAMVLVLWIVQLVTTRLGQRRAKAQEETVPVQSKRGWHLSLVLQSGLLAGMLCFSLFSALRMDYVFYGQLPFAYGFRWPETTAHVALAKRFVNMIPPQASVAAQSKLVPHVSQRNRIYLFPYDLFSGNSKQMQFTDDSPDYIFLDVTSDVYPFWGSMDYIQYAKTVLISGHYGIVAAEDGYLLLKRGAPAPALSQYSAVIPNAYFDHQTYDYQLLPEIPESFCSYVQSTPDQVKNSMQVDFVSKDGGSISFLGYTGIPDTFSRGSGYVTMTTYWRLNQTLKTPMKVLITVRGSDGVEHFASTDFPATFWCQTNTWKPGQVIQLTSRSFGLQNENIPNGLAHFSVSLVPLVQPEDKIMDVHVRLPVQVVHAPQEVKQEASALQVKPVKIIS